MNPREAEELVDQAVEMTGSAPPQMLQADAPVLRQTDQNFYLVGLIGGKEVGKSALVNALAGQKITQETNFGPGTDMAIAYVHRDRSKALAQLLDAELEGQYRIVAHQEQSLGAQVLLDLPDIDSRFADHVQIVRKMLRHMLFPIWIQSVEKYADAQPQKLLAQVAAGNDPRNFLFCLNKADQLTNTNGQAEEIRQDYAARLARVLSLPQPPRVFMTCATDAEKFDLPELAKLLSQEKSADVLAESRELADRRRQKSLLDWLDKQDLPGRAARLARLEDEASELLAQRLGVRIVETILPRLLEDPNYRLVMTDGLFAARVARWPIVNVLHTLLSPLRLMVRENAAAGTFFAGAEALVDAHLSAAQPPVANLVQSGFAQLQQSDPAIAKIYDRRKLWETMDAQAAAGRLRTDWIETIHRQREQVLNRLLGHVGIIAPFFRVILTIGALLWFPIVQPILQIILTTGTPLKSLRDAGILFVELTSTAALLKNAVFLIIWFFLLWSLLRWDTRRRVERLLARWAAGKQPDAELNLTASSLEWIDDLLSPLRSARENAQRLAQRVKSLREELDGPSK
jgi:hypothetical protein